MANILLNQMIKFVKITRLKGLIERIAPKYSLEWKEYFRIKKKVEEGHTLIDLKELEPQLHKAVQWIVEHENRSVIGDYLEFGVYYGSSLACMYKVLESFRMNNVRLFGFDSFEGLPETAISDDNGNWSPGAFKSSYKYTVEYLTKKDIDWNRVFLVKGWYSITLNDELIRKYNISKASLIMIDCDMYLSAKEALNFCTPLIQDRAIIIFDDWNASQLADKNLGEKRAFDEFLAANPHLTAQEFGNYNAPGGLPHGKVFKVLAKSK